MTPVEVYTLIRNQITEASPDFYGETELYNLIWNAEKILAAETGCAETSSSISSAAGTREYTRPTTAQRISRLTWDKTKLKKINFTDIDKFEGDTENDGDPIFYYEYGTSIGLVPTPISIADIKIYFNAVPTQLTALSTAFTIPSEYAHYLSDYALSFMYMKDQQMSEADRHKGAWETNLKVVKDQWGSRRAMDSYPVVRDEDAYPFTDQGII